MFQNMSVIEFLLEGGFVSLLLVFCSIISLSIIVERLLVFFKIHRDYNKALPLVMKSVQSKKFGEYSQLSKQLKSEVAEILLLPLAKRKKSKVAVDSQIERMAGQLIMQMEKRLGILATLGSTTPFIGLFGTVIGIIKTFLGLSVNQSYSTTMITRGIAEALVNTGAGLFVAIPAVIAFNYFTTTIKRFMNNLELQVSEIVDLSLEENAS